MENENSPRAYGSVLPPWAQYAFISLIIMILIAVLIAVVMFIFNQMYGSEDGRRLDKLEKNQRELTVRMDTALFMIGRNQAAIENLKQER
jgi:Tfp pilus assembly protein PilO